MLSYLESYKASLTFSIDPECTYLYVYEHTKFEHKHKYVQIILVLLNPHQQGWNLCADGIMNSLHINEHLAMLKQEQFYHFCKYMLVLKPQCLCCLLYSGDACVSSLEGKGLCACTQFTCHLKIWWIMLKSYYSFKSVCKQVEMYVVIISTV